MFQKHSIMSLKKKSKSLGHLAALNSHPCSPDMEPKVQRNGGGNNGYQPPRRGGDSGQPTAAKYMKRLLSPSSQDRQPYRPDLRPDISSPVDVVRTNKIDKQLQTKEKITPKKLKGVMKTKSQGEGGSIMSNPVAMGKALIARNFTPTKTPNGSPARTAPDPIADMFPGKDGGGGGNSGGGGGMVTNKHRAFLMDTQVKYTIGVQSQERNLFLFNDLLLIAKERSSSHFKLKDQVPLSDVWLSTCISEVSEVTLDPTTSFVIGWPINNAVITFGSASQKEAWWERLSALVAAERSHSPAGASINITYFHSATNFEHLKSIYVAITDSSRDCIKKALEVLDIGEEGKAEPEAFQLWAKTKLDEAPYPLIGHEIPLVIKLHWMRQTFNNKNQKTYDEYRQGCRCSFILRRVGQVSSFTEATAGSQKKKLKKVKSSMKLQNVFRRVSQAGRSQEEDQQRKEPAGKLFGRSLQELCSTSGGEEGTFRLPHPVVMMLRQLADKGPETVGIFRRGPNVRAMRDIRDKLDEGATVHWDEISVFVTAALLKDLLRSMPDCLLQCESYSAWVEAAHNYTKDNNIHPLKSHVERLPPPNHYLLRHLLFILHKTDANHQENMMTSSNLSICVGPSLLWSTDPAYMLEQTYTKEVSATIQILIQDYERLFGREMPALFLQEADEAAANIRVGGRPFSEHSSLDSLLDSAYPEDDLARNSGAEGHSLTNLSHDSGLTTSDSQLYAFEDAETNNNNNNNNNSFSSDDFCIETITSNENKVHAIVNKKFLSRYQNAYNRQHHQHDEEECMEEGEEDRLVLINGQDNSSNNNSAAKRKLNQKRQTHKDRMQRRIQRHSAYDAGSGSNGDGGSGSGHFVSPSRPDTMDPIIGYNNYDVRTTKMSFPLRRTASEESVQQQQQRSSGSTDFIQHILHGGGGGAANSRRRRQVAHRKGRAPNPPRGGGGSSKTSPSIIRSNSVNQVVRHHHWGGAADQPALDWYRSKSTTRLNSEDSEESCSTLSDEDSTPHVSRSNSYGRSEDNSFASVVANGQLEDERSAYDDTTYDIYLHDERILNMATDLDDAFVSNSRRSKSAREFDSFSCETPPGYEESIYRQRLLRLRNTPTKPSTSASASYLARPARASLSSKSSPTPQILQSQQQQQQQQQQSANLPDKVIIERQVELSAKAKAVFEQSLKKYNENLKEGTTPPPLPPKTDRPPLPPKQRSRRSTEHESSDDQTYVNSADLRGGGSRGGMGGNNRTRLNIGGPTTPLPNNSKNNGVMSQHNHHQTHSSSDERESSEFVYGSYLSAKGSTTRVSVPAPHYSPPTLPPKEVGSRLPIAGDNALSAERKLSSPATAGKKKQVTATKIVTTARVMKSVETQTDENDFFSLFPDERPDDDDSFFNSNTTDSEYSPESNRSLSPEYPQPGIESSGSGANNSGIPPIFYRPPVGDSERKSEFFLTSSPAPTAVTAMMTATLFERPVSAQSVGGGLRTAGRRKLEPVASAPGRHHVDPVMAGEINWSVSQLRSLFNQGLAAQSRTESAGSNYEPAGQDQFNNGGRITINNHMHDHTHHRLYHNDHLSGHHDGRHNGGSSVLHFATSSSGLKSSPYSNYASTAASSGLGGGFSGGHSYSSMYSGDNQHSDSDQESYV